MKTKTKTDFTSPCKHFANSRSWWAAKFKKLVLWVATWDQTDKRPQASALTKWGKCKCDAFMISARGLTNFSASEIQTSHQAKNSRTKTFGSRENSWTLSTSENRQLVEPTCSGQEPTLSKSKEWTECGWKRTWRIILKCRLLSKKFF